MTTFAEDARNQDNWRAPLGRLATRVSSLLAPAALALFATSCNLPEPPDGGPVGPPLCGGLAGIECPGAGECVDDPSDDCDPELGGADCSGLCECNAIGLCTDGLAWDSSPHVCGCAPPDYDPCIATLCPVGTICVNQDGQGVCLSVDGGLPGEQCGANLCGPGLVCCNASCGICTAPDGACIQIACE